MKTIGKEPNKDMERIGGGGGGRVGEWEGEWGLERSVSEALNNAFPGHPYLPTPPSTGTAAAPHPASRRPCPTQTTY